MIALKRLPRFCLLRGLSQGSAKISTASSPQMCKAQTTNEEAPTAAPINAATKNVLRTLGQPTSKTHPHLIQPHELVPGVMLDEFQSRRKKLMRGLQTYAESFGDDFNGNASKCHMVRWERAGRNPNLLILSNLRWSLVPHPRNI